MNNKNLKKAILGGLMALLLVANVLTTSPTTQSKITSGKGITILSIDPPIPPHAPILK